jgi:hypothetical protein
MIGYAYRNKNNVLNIVKDYKTAKEFAFSNIIEINFENYLLLNKIKCDHTGNYYQPGFLQVDDKIIIDYGDGKTYINGNEENGIKLEDYKKIDIDFYNKVKNILEGCPIILINTKRINIINDLGELIKKHRTFLNSIESYIDNDNNRDYITFFNDYWCNKIWDIYYDFGKIINKYDKKELFID